MNGLNGRSREPDRDPDAVRLFRDQCQHGMGLVRTDPELCREMIPRLLSTLSPEGRPPHSTLEEQPDRDCPDDGLWIPLLLADYLHETGDEQLLKRKVGYSGSEVEASILRHMHEALDFVDTRRGSHGLPLLGDGDGGESIQPGRGESRTESVWTAQLYCMALRRAEDICRWLDRPEKREQHRDRREEMEERINEVAREEGRYRRLVRDTRSGGTPRPREGERTFLRTQLGGGLGDVAPPQQRDAVISTALERLDTRWGLRNLSPSFSEPDPEWGRISQYLPGERDNGSIPCREGAWLLDLLARIGRRGELLERLRQLSPTTHARQQPDLYRLEPYVFCGHVSGPDSAQFGAGNLAWGITGPAWMYRFLVDEMFGLRPEPGGMRVDPALPAPWEEISFHRLHRGVRWEVHVRQQPEGQGTIESISLNGTSREDPLLPYPTGENRQQVEVRIQ